MFNDAPMFLRDFLMYLRTIKSLSERTVQEYYYDLILFLKYISFRKKYPDSRDIPGIDIKTFDVMLLDKVNIMDLHSYIAYRDSERENNSTTRARKISSLRGLYKYLVNVSKEINNNPTLELDTPKIKKRNPVYLTLNESIKLLETVNENKNNVLKKRDFAIILTFLTTGVRLSELASMNINSVKDNQFSVVGKGNKERIVYMTESCKYAIEDYISIRPKVDEKEQALFLSTRKQRMSNRAIQHMIEKYLNMAGFDTSVYSTHKLRHTAATLMYKEGVDIRTLQKILGHTSVATTQIYTHVDDDDMKNAIEHNPLSKINTKK